MSLWHDEVVCFDAGQSADIPIITGAYPDRTQQAFADLLSKVSGICARCREKPPTFQCSSALLIRIEGVPCDSVLGSRHFWDCF